MPNYYAFWKNAFSEIKLDKGGFLKRNFETENAKHTA
jgi:hypothetical protein